MKSLKSVKLPSWLKCLRSVWAICIALSFILGYLMGMYQEPDEKDGMLADVREDPLNTYYREIEDDFGFHKRKKSPPRRETA